MDEQQRKLLYQYRNQLIGLILFIISLLISIYVINLLIKITKYGADAGEYKKIKDASTIASFIVLIVLLYFTYIGYQTYLKSKTKANLSFLIALILVLIAAFMRFITISSSITDDVSGAEDVI